MNLTLGNSYLEFVIGQNDIAKMEYSPFICDSLVCLTEFACGLFQLDLQTCEFCRLFYGTKNLPHNVERLTVLVGGHAEIHIPITGMKEHLAAECGNRP